MTIDRPFFLTTRQFVDGHYTEGGRSQYVHDPRYADRPDRFIRSFLLLQSDINELFSFVEPADANLSAYSLRTLELLIRTCIEVEANFKAILSANKYSKPPHRWKIPDYHLIGASHYLAEYRVKIPYWNGIEGERCPFKDWGTPPKSDEPWKLPWYQAYNRTKHDRVHALADASLVNLVDAWCGLLVVLTAQFLYMDFTPGPVVFALESHWSNDGFRSAIGGYLRVVYPIDVPQEDRYEFDWESLRATAAPFARYDYDAAALNG